MTARTLSLAVMLGAALAVAGKTPPALAAAPTAPAADALPDAYAAQGDGITYFNTPNRRHTTIRGAEAKVLGQVSVDLKRAADVMIQFTSGLATVSDEGCPCSVRATLQIDGQAGIVIKRVNLATAAARPADKYVPDRQPLDGSYVASLPTGRHDIALVAQQVDGSAKELQVFYTNIQAVVFPRSAAGQRP
jgi:hypothetical protein